MTGGNGFRPDNTGEGIIPISSLSKKHVYMKILNTKAIQSVDHATCEAQNISTIDLMGASCLRGELRTDKAGSCQGNGFVIIAGPGNNGGDALAVARMLIEQGYKRVEVFLFNVTGKLSHDCEEERNKLITIDGVDFSGNQPCFQSLPISARTM